MDLNVCAVNCGNWKSGEKCSVVNWGYWSDILKTVFAYTAVYKPTEGPIYTVNMLLAHVKQHGSTDLLALKMF